VFAAVCLAEVKVSAVRWAIRGRGREMKSANREQREGKVRLLCCIQLAIVYD